MTYLRAGRKEEVERQNTTFDRLSRTHREFFHFISRNVDIGPETKIVELGCGGGCFTAMLADQFPGQIEGWDIDGGFISAARDLHAGDRRFANRLMFRQIGFHEAIPSAMLGAFDVVCFRETMMCVKDAVGLLRWVKRLLTEGGQIVALEPDYGMTTMYPEVPHWEDFFDRYKQFCGIHDEDFLFGRSLLDVFKKAALQDISVVPLVELHTCLESAALKHFIDVEIKSIRQDMPRFVKETGYNTDRIKEMLRAMKNLHRHPGAYVQTHMIGICGRP